MKIHFGHCVGKYDPKLPRTFCAGIGPLQLGVVLVISFFKKINISKYHNNILVNIST